MWVNQNSIEIWVQTKQKQKTNNFNHSFVGVRSIQMQTKCWMITTIPSSMLSRKVQSLMSARIIAEFFSEMFPASWSATLLTPCWVNLEKLLTLTCRRTRTASTTKKDSWAGSQSSRSSGKYRSDCTQPKLTILFFETVKQRKQSESWTIRRTKDFSFVPHSLVRSEIQNLSSSSINRLPKRLKCQKKKSSVDFQSPWTMKLRLTTSMSSSQRSSAKLFTLLSLMKRTSNAKCWLNFLVNLREVTTKIT